MTVEQTLKDLSSFTWSTIAGSIRLGIVIREDGLTAMTLAFAAQREPDLTISVYPPQVTAEEYGADFSWTSGDATYLVKAKRLDPMSLKYSGFDPEQSDTLIEVAKNLEVPSGTPVTPVYVFYNSIGGSDLNPEDWGCTYALASAVQEIVGSSRTKSFDALKDVQRPWYEMFPSKSGQGQGKRPCTPSPGESAAMSQIVIGANELPTRIIIGRSQ